MKLALALLPTLLGGSTVEEIACATFIHGVPYTLVAALPKNPDPMAKLIAIVNDASKQKCWANAVSMIGIIGDEKQAGLIVGIITQGNGRITEHQWDAKFAAVQALGFLANKGGDKPMDFLKKLVESRDRPGFLSWNSPTMVGGNHQLYVARAAVQALGISGRREALYFLQGIMGNKELGDVVSDALESNRKVARDGLAGFYGK